MKSTNYVISAIALLLPAVQGYLLSAIGTLNNSVFVYRIWYGDGKAYAGKSIPEGIVNAFNFTLPFQRPDVLFIEPDSQNSPGGIPDLPDLTFPVASINAEDPQTIYFVHNAVGLAVDQIYMFTGALGFILPTTRSGLAPGKAYLVPTDTPETFEVWWIVNDSKARDLGAIRVDLSIRG